MYKIRYSQQPRGALSVFPGQSVGASVAALSVVPQAEGSSLPDLQNLILLLSEIRVGKKRE